MPPKEEESLNRVGEVASAESTAESKISLKKICTFVFHVRDVSLCAS